MVITAIQLNNAMTNDGIKGIRVNSIEYVEDFVEVVLFVDSVGKKLTIKVSLDFISQLDFMEAEIDLVRYLNNLVQFVIKEHNMVVMDELFNDTKEGK